MNRFNVSLFPKNRSAGDSRANASIGRVNHESALTRRQLLASSGSLIGAALLGGQTPRVLGAESLPPEAVEPFRFCLNTATIRGQKLGIVKEVEVAAKAGFQAIEPWVSSIEEYVKSGGSLDDLKKRISDAGLTVESAIAFAEWIADDETKRAKGLEQAKREMDLVARIGGKRFAAPPAGATNLPALDLMAAAERYRTLLEAGDAIGIVPELELWGFSRNLHLLGECAFVAIETKHPKACVLVDIFHLYKGGSDFRSLKLLSRQAIQLVHVNDYPSEPGREQINDSYRVFPGEGTAPLVEVLRVLRSLGGQTVLSLEVFNKHYWEQDALESAKTGLMKMKQVAAAAMS